MSEQNGHVQGLRGFRLVAIEEIAASGFNPRKTFDQGRLEELAASLKEKGMLQPILLRPLAENRDGASLEIVAGERRWRAAKMAGLEEVPARVVELDDQAALEFAIIENDQREDIHPMEQAQGYQALLERGYDVETIAAKTGKSASFVYQRVKLLEIVPEARELLEAEVITAGHAILLARLSPELQREALVQLPGESVDGFYADSIEEHLKQLLQEYLNPNVSMGVISVRELGRVIRDEIMRDLTKAPWDLTNDRMVPGPGQKDVVDSLCLPACASCIDNTAATDQLFPDLAGKARCLNRKCFEAKMVSIVRKAMAAARETYGREPLLIGDYSTPDYLLEEFKKELKPWAGSGVQDYQFKRAKGKKPCASAQPAVVMWQNPRHAAAMKMGEQLLVCTDRKCEKHWGGQVAPSSGVYGSDDYKEKQKQEQQKQKIERACREAIFRQVLACDPEEFVPLMALRSVCRAIVGEMGSDICRLLCGALEIDAPANRWNTGKDFSAGVEQFVEATAAGDLARLAELLSVARDLGVWSFDLSKPEQLEALAKRHGLDVGEIRKEVKATMKPKKKAAKKGNKAEPAGAAA